MADTPAYRHVAPVAGESTDLYRLRVLENAVFALTVRFDKHMDHVQKNEVVQAAAVARCERHDGDVTVLREVTAKHEAAIHVLQETVEREPTRTVPTPARSVWDVLYHPATPMAFCIVAMIYFFTLYISATTGREASSLVPHVPTSGKP